MKSEAADVEAYLGEVPGEPHHCLHTSQAGATGPTEMLGVDVWSDAAGMGEYYASLSGFEAAYSDEPQTSVWQQGTGGSWTEW